MRKIGRIFFALACFCILMGCTAALAPRACAAPAMTASESCIEFIKDIEDFSPQPYYDYGQHTVGYGTKCPSDKYFDYLTNGITKSEAEALLREAVAEVSDAIHSKLMEPYGITFTQHQFDALVSFSFNLGTGWMTYDSTLRSAILTGADDDEFVYAFSLYSTAGGNYVSGLVTRRLCEANMFLNGVYSTTASSAYGYVFYEPYGGSLTYQVQGYICESRSEPVADARRTGDVFLGWYTDLTGGTKVTELTKALNGKTLFARWQSAEDPENQGSASTVVRVTGDVVNIRNGPGTNYGISSRVYRNDVLIVSHVTQLSGRSWGKVQNGWICLDYTTYNDALSGNEDTGSSPDPSEDADTPDRTPEQNDRPQEEVPREDQVMATGTVSVSDRLRIRSGPGTAYSTVGYLSNGSRVQILEQTKSGTTVWGRISQGWVSMDYILTEDPATQEDDKPHWEHKPRPRPGQEDPGENETAVITGTVTADALRIRSGPGTGNSIVGFYYQDDTVHITEKRLVNSVYWGKTDQGWINMDYVLTESSREEPSRQEGLGVMTVIADCLRVRKEIGTDSRIAELLYYGDTVTVLETRTVDGTLWGKVENGWICMDYVQ